MLDQKSWILQFWFQLRIQRIQNKEVHTLLQIKHNRIERRNKTEKIKHFSVFEI